MAFYCSTTWGLLFTLLLEVVVCISGRVGLGSRLYANDNQVWASNNNTFAFGFAPTDSGLQDDRYQLGIWFADLPGDRTMAWSAYVNSPVTKDAILELDTTGNLVLTDGKTTAWTSNTTGADVESAELLENGNLVLYTSDQNVAWQSFAHPSDTLLPGQPLTISTELTSSWLPSLAGGYYTLKMLQEPTSLTLALTYNLPADPYNLSMEAQSNYSYWATPEFSNVTGDVVAVLDQAGSFGVVYGGDSIGAVYVYKNDNDKGELSAASNKTNRPLVLRRLILETNGNLRLYRWDNDVNGSRQWVPEWAAVSNPCDITGVCGNGICNLDRTKTNASCDCLPGSSTDGKDFRCMMNSSFTGNCRVPVSHENRTSNFKIQTVNQTNYYFQESAVIANYSDIPTVSKCGDACLSDCECVASVYGLNQETPYCWVLRNLQFGGFEDSGSTMFVKVQSNGSFSRDLKNHTGMSSSTRAKVLVLPIVLSMFVLIGLLCSLLYIYVHKRRSLKRALNSSLIVSGAPVSFNFRDLQNRTNHFSELLGTGGFGSVYKGSLGDGTLIAVKKLDRMLPHGEREFVTEVNTIGSMHHMNLVRLCGYCSEGSQRLLVYEFMKNGSLDKWLFPSHKTRERLLEWPTRFQIAVGTAQGIAYFHEQCRNRIIHCDIKPENILLDENFCPKVSDFGLAKLMGREHSQVVTMVRGTRGYLAPEWISNRPVTVKADVYSYGMLLLEIVGGRRNLDMSFDADDFFFPGWAFKGMQNGDAMKVADRRLEGAVEENEVLRALKVGFWCIQDDVSMRPSMSEVVMMLEGSVEINEPPMPQSVLELIEEGLDHVYKAMKREINQFSSFTVTNKTSQPSSRATCSYSTMSPR
ncbi:G-type lectin S-receptor-like serine/threonine-protein kinase At5g24080 [Cynara cardunculus var. scolymus]|uniref:G-type lectin S-receptor-like serine/threonine-protein kinase At5g24080 n=1 Tax=Cynara cardunculus var. scolymus TaxID=59895 RepID=UPI000D62B716|nr:G-type lectin S-receptor-like serine/threonine-protein kinase At5g24080 [Cynara cardunculus var. scolymus]